jgi:prepilin-type N-terminal cleavage/methylation domain-containing protein
MDKHSGDCGFSLVEALIVLCVAAILAAAATPSIQDGVRHYRADAGQETVLMQLRLGRSLAVDQRRIHRVTIGDQGRITLSRIDAGGTTEISAVELPGGVTFHLEQGVPVDGEAAPDGLGTDAAINLNNSNSIWFRPDGSAVDVNGIPCNGVIHLASAGLPSTARSVTIFGATGRIRSWRFEAASAGGGQWK